MQESQVRRMEHDIARACYESFVVQPWLCKPARNAVTYVSRFYDARKAFIDRLYKSQVIPRGKDLMAIKLTTQADGSVRVTCPWTYTLPDTIQLSGLALEKALTIVVDSMTLGSEVE